MCFYFSATPTPLFTIDPNAFQPLHPSDPGGIQTHNLLIRSQMLYSVKLRGLAPHYFAASSCCCATMRALRIKSSFMFARLPVSLRR